MSPSGMIRKLQAKKGFGLIEIIIASAIISASLVALAGVSQLAFRVILENTREKRAGFLAEENLEVVRILRDLSWSSNVAPRASEVTYYPVFDSALSTWSLSSTPPGLIDGMFLQTLVFGDVYRRNSDDDIVASTSPDSKTLDLDTKLVTSRVLWEEGKEVELITYITNMFDN